MRLPSPHSSSQNGKKTDDYSSDRTIDRAVIGYGNPLRRDDRAGFSVAEYLHAAGTLPKSVTVIATHQLLPELAELLSRVDQVIFVDAELIPPIAPIDPATSEHPKLTIRSLTLNPAALPPHLDPHRSSPEGLLALAYSLYDRTPAAAWLVGIPAIDFSFGEQLSMTTQAGIAQAIDWIMQQISEPIPPPNS